VQFRYTLPDGVDGGVGIQMGLTEDGL
jgi:hypothetical protein